MIRTKIKTNKLPRITGAEAEFYNPYEHHKQNLNNKVLFPKRSPIFWDADQGVFWNGYMFIKLDKPPKIPKSKELEYRALPGFGWELSRATIFAEMSTQEHQSDDAPGALLHAVNEQRTKHHLYDARTVDMIRTRYPSGRPHICANMGMLVFETPDGPVGGVMPHNVKLTEYQEQRLVELGFDKQYHIDPETIGDEL